MGGIAGIIRFDGAPVDQALLPLMKQVMAYRGRDGCGTACLGSASFLHFHTITTAEAHGECQPLTDAEDQLMLVMDGRIDNRAELRSALGRPFGPDAPDSAYLLAAFHRWGQNFPEHVDGDFAAVIWSAAGRRALLVRDRFGCRPLFYIQHGPVLAFASEVAALNALPFAARQLNEGYFAEVLSSLLCSEDETFWTDIRRVRPACAVTFTPNGAQTRRYWMPDPDAPPAAGSAEDIAAEYLHLLTDALRRMSRSHAPLACEVSGGLDSSALFAILDRLWKSGELNAPGVEGYTLLTGPEAPVSELAYARAVGAHLGRGIREVPLTYEPLEWFEEEARRTGCFPGYPNSALTNDMRKAAECAGSRVIVAGVGGDELLSGTRRYYAEAIEERDWGGLLSSLVRDGRACGWPRAFWSLLRHGLMPGLPQPVRRWWKARRGTSGSAYIDTVSWLDPHLRTLLADRLRQRAGRLGAENFGLRFGDLWRGINSPIGLLARETDERTAARIDLEVRRPFLDRRLAEFLLTVPLRHRVRGNTDKHFHRLAMAGLLPDRVLSRHDKMDFTFTNWPYFKDSAGGLMSKLKPSETAAFVAPEEVVRLAAKVGDEAFSGWPEYQLWTLFGCLSIRKPVIELWS